MKCLAAEAGLDRHDHRRCREAPGTARAPRAACAGRSASPAARPAARIRRSVGSIGSSTSTWNVIESQPAARNSSRYRPGSAIIRCASKGSRVTGRSAAIEPAAEREVRHEVPVHHVEMDPVRARPCHPADLAGEVREIGIEDARGDPCPALGHQRALPGPGRARCPARVAALRPRIGPGPACPRPSRRGACAVAARRAGGGPSPSGPMPGGAGSALRSPRSAAADARLSCSRLRPTAGGGASPARSAAS